MYARHIFDFCTYKKYLGGKSMAMSEKEWMHIFAGNLNSLMEESHMTQQQLSRATGITQSTISRYLNEQCMPSVNALVNIAYVFPLANIEDLLCFDDLIEMKPSRRW